MRAGLTFAGAAYGIILQVQPSGPVTGGTLMGILVMALAGYCGGILAEKLAVKKQ